MERKEGERCRGGERRERKSGEREALPQTKKYAYHYTTGQKHSAYTKEATGNSISSGVSQLWLSWERRV